MNQRFVQPVFHKGSMQGFISHGIVYIFVLAALVWAPFTQAASVDKSDLNNDYTVDILDLQIFSTMYLEQNWETVDWCNFYESSLNDKKYFRSLTSEKIASFESLLNFIVDLYNCQVTNLSTDKSDLNNDLVIDLSDLGIFSSNYLERYWESVDWCLFHESTLAGTVFEGRSTKYYLRHFGLLLSYINDYFGCDGAEPPPSVSGFTGVVSLGKIDLSWTNPDDPDFAGTLVCRSTSGHPDNPASCQPVYTGNASGYADIEVSNGSLYYYAAWAYDAGGNYSTRMIYSPPSTPYPTALPPPPPPVNQPAFSSSGGEIIEPQRLFLTETGLFLVSDGKRRDVLRVNPTSFQIIEALHLDDKPLAVARLGDDIYVGKEEEGSIQIFSPKGAPKGYLVAPGNIGYPGSIDVDPAQGLVMVLDGKTQEVFIYNASSQALIWRFGSGVLINPAGLAVDTSRQEILVSNIGDDVSNPFLSIFSYAGGSIGSLVATLTSSGCGAWGCTTVGFSRPQGVAVYNDKIFLVDALLSQVLIYDRPTLTHLLTLGSADPLTRELRLPSDIEINAAGDVYVISRIENLIVKFAGGAL